MRRFVVKNYRSSHGLDEEFTVVNLPHGMNGEKIVVIVEIYLDS